MHLTKAEQPLFDSFRTYFPDEEILDAGPSRADIANNGSKPKDRGIFIVTRNALWFYGFSTNMVCMGWSKIIRMERDTGLVYGKLRIALETGTWRFSLGKTFSTLATCPGQTRHVPNTTAVATPIAEATRIERLIDRNRGLLRSPS